MKYQSDYYRVSGLTIERCCFLANRFDARHGYKPRESESMIAVLTVKKSENKTNVYMPLVTSNWLTGLWLSESETLFVTDAFDQVLRLPKALRPGLRPASFETTPLGASLTGIWGVNDACVFAWGGRLKKKNELASEYPVFCFDGKKWRELPLPGFNVFSMHGLSTNIVYAVGDEGGIAFWNGSKWKRFPAPPGSGAFTSVFAAAPNEVYAVSSSNILVEGGTQGFSKVATANIPLPSLAAVAKWKDELWVGAGSAGLLRRIKKTNKFEVVKPNVHGLHFDARRELVIVCPNMIVSTSNGKDFVGCAQDVVLKARKGKRLNNP